MVVGRGTPVSREGKVSLVALLEKVEQHLVLEEPGTEDINDRIGATIARDTKDQTSLGIRCRSLGVSKRLDDQSLDIRAVQRRKLSYQRFSQPTWHAPILQPGEPSKR